MKYLLDIAVLVILYVWKCYPPWREKGWGVLLVRTLMYIYLCLVLYVTLMPVVASLPFVLDHPYTPMNLVPFIDVLSGRGDFIRQVVLNVVMTVPFGFLFPQATEKPAGFGETVRWCFLMSLSIELLQPLINGVRSSDITDLITNVTGGVIGYGLYLGWNKVVGNHGLSSFLRPGKLPQE